MKSTYKNMQTYSDGLQKKKENKHDKYLYLIQLYLK